MKKLIVFKRKDKKDDRYYNIQIISHFSIIKKINEYKKNEDNINLRTDTLKNYTNFKEYNYININNVCSGDADNETTGNKYLDNFIKDIRDKYYKNENNEEFVATDFIKTNYYIEMVEDDESADYSQIYKNLYTKYKSTDY